MSSTPFLHAVLLPSLLACSLFFLLIPNWVTASSPVMFSQVEVLKSVPNDALGTIFDSIIDPTHSQDQSAQVPPPLRLKSPQKMQPQPPIKPVQVITPPSHNQTHPSSHPFKPIKTQAYRPPSTQKPFPAPSPKHHSNPTHPTPDKPLPPEQGETKTVTEPTPCPSAASHVTILLWILMLLVYLFWKGIHYWWALLPTPALSRSLIQLDEAYYSFYREICFFLSIVGVMLFCSLFSSSHAAQSLRQVVFAFTHFLVFWFVGGFLVLIIAQIKARQWLKYESLIVRSQDWAQRIQKQYELLYLQHKEAQLRPFVEYLVMRQEFITPSYLPMLRESFHRSDFNFADYLVRSLADTLAHFFSLRIVSLLLCLAVFLVAHFLSKLNYSSQVGAIIVVVFLLLVLFCSQLSIFHLGSVFEKLVPAIEHPSYVNLQLELDTIDPFQHYNRLLRPEYLGGENDDERQSESGLESSHEHLPRFGREEEERHRLSGWDMPEPRLTNIRVGGSSKPTTHCRCIHSNRHQSLFCCGRIGIQILFSLQQLLFLSTMLTLNYFIFSNGPGSIHEKLGKYAIAFYLALLFLLLAIFVLIQMPLWAIRFTLCTSLQMMKKRKVESQVLKELHLRASQRNVRVYQTLKLIRRELLQERAPPLHQVKLRRISRRLLYEIFALYRKPDPTSASSSPFIVDSQDCESLSRLCGNKLTRRQQFVLLKSTKSRSAISFTDALLFIEGNMNDAALTVNSLVMELFALYYNQPHCPTHLSLQDLLNFFQEFETYFETEDISEFLEELKLTMREKSHRPGHSPMLSLTVHEIALRLRNEIERFPR